MTSATDELRRLLDERGVEWSDLDTRTGDASDYITDWTVPGHGWAVGREISGYISYTWVMGERFTPEQAIDATLGRGTCEVIGFDDGYDEGLDGEWFALAPATWFLSCDHEAHGQRPSYCPVCGRKVKEG